MIYTPWIVGALLNVMQFTTWLCHLLEPTLFVTNQLDKQLSKFTAVWRRQIPVFPAVFLSQWRCFSCMLLLNCGIMGFPRQPRFQADLADFSQLIGRYPSQSASCSGTLRLAHGLVHRGVHQALLEVLLTHEATTHICIVCMNTVLCAKTSRRTFLHRQQRLWQQTTRWHKIAHHEKSATVNPRRPMPNCVTIDTCLWSKLGKPCHQPLHSQCPPCWHILLLGFLTWTIFQDNGPCTELNIQFPKSTWCFCGCVVLLACFNGNMLVASESPQMCLHGNVASLGSFFWRTSRARHSIGCSHVKFGSRGSVERSEISWFN